MLCIIILGVVFCIAMVSIVMLSVTFSLLCRVSLSLLSHFLLLCRVSLCWVSLFWLSWLFNIPESKQWRTVPFCITQKVSFLDYRLFLFLKRSFSQLKTQLPFQFHICSSSESPVFAFSKENILLLKMTRIISISHHRGIKYSWTKLGRLMKKSSKNWSACIQGPMLKK